MALIIRVLNWPAAPTQLTQEDGLTHQGQENTSQNKKNLSQNQTHFSVHVSLSLPSNYCNCLPHFHTLVLSLSLPHPPSDSLAPSLAGFHLKGGKISLANKSPINKLLTAGQYRVDCRGEGKRGTETAREETIPGRRRSLPSVYILNKS